MLKIELQFFGGRGATSALKGLNGSFYGGEQARTMRKEENDMRESGGQE